jgi:hypothetical protein
VFQLWAQAGAVLTVSAPPRVAAARNSVLTVPVTVQVKKSYHVNSNTPDDEYLIPLTLTWDAPNLELRDIVYPQPEKSTFAFSAKPVSVFTGTFEIVSRFAVPAKAPPGPSVLTGKLRYQACTGNMCMPPKTVEVRAPVEIRVQ